MFSSDELVTFHGHESLDWVACCGVLGSEINGTHEKQSQGRVFPFVFMRNAEVSPSARYQDIAVCFLP